MINLKKIKILYPQCVGNELLEKYTRHIFHESAKDHMGNNHAMNLNNLLITVNIKKLTYCNFSSKKS